MRRKWQPPADRQFGHAVHDGPCPECNWLGVTRWKKGGLLAIPDKTQQRRIGFPPCFLATGAPLENPRPVKHDREMLRISQRKMNVAPATQLKAFDRTRTARRSLVHGFRQPLETFGGNLGQQIVPAPKVAVRRVVGDACPPGNFPKCKSMWANLADELDGGVDQSLLEIPVVIGTGAWHSEAILAKNVDNANMSG